MRELVLESSIEIFSNEAFGSIRIVMKDGKPLFCGKDVAEALGYKRTADAITTHCKGVCELPTPTSGGIQKMKYIPEGDLYRLVAHSELPSAEKFESWIFDEVLPCIRKTGGYVSNDDLFIETYFSTVDESTKAVLRTTLSTVREQNKRIAEMKPKEDYYNALVDRGTNLSFRNTEKEIGAPEKRFVRFLLENGYVYRNKNSQLEPYAEHVKNGLFVMKESKSEKTKWSGSQTLITVQGRDKLRKEYWERGDKPC